MAKSLLPRTCTFTRTFLPLLCRVMSDKRQRIANSLSFVFHLTFNTYHPTSGRRPEKCSVFSVLCSDRKGRSREQPIAASPILVICHPTSNTYHPTSGRRPSASHSHFHSHFLPPTLQSDAWGKFKFESKFK